MNGVGGSPVVLVSWPSDAEQLGQLRALGVPRLLLVAADHPAPVDEDPQQDWIRLPAPDSDLWARVRSLELRAGAVAAKPELAGDGRLVYRGRWTVISPTAERLLGLLTEHFTAVVSTGELLAVGWPDGGGTTGALRIHLMKIRRLLDPVGLELVLVPTRGYVLQPAGASAS